MNTSLDTLIQRALRRLLLGAAQRLVGADVLDAQGILRFRAVPFETLEEYLRWWAPARDEAGKMLALPRMSEREKERYTVLESHNILTALGKQYLLTYAGSPNPGTPAWAQYFALGSTTLATVNAGDTQLAGEFYRQIPTSYTVSGNQVDISSFLPAGTASGTITNAGVFGVAATATANSGTLMNHVLCGNYVKAAFAAITADYDLILSS